MEDGGEQELSAKEKQKQHDRILEMQDAASLELQNKYKGGDSFAYHPGCKTTNDITTDKYIKQCKMLANGYLLGK